ncbi:trypsin-like peptidase domain-containing protein [Streptomyces sp. 11x1]|uniref:S1C family serine protease n=1 Tax=Streptomyces sp. 11x1 TaxID=3038642 RepID=UPI0037D99445
MHDPDPYGTPPYGEPGPWAPAPPVQHPATAPASGTASAPAADARPTAPAHGTAVPATAQQPTPAAPQAPAASYAEAPVPAAAAPFPDVSQSAATPYPDSSPPPGASYAYPSQPGPPPFGDSARTVPPPYAGGAQAAQSPQAATHSSRGPWQNYDPWAGSGSLQQNGAAVDDVARRHRRRGRTLLVGALLIAVVAGGVGGVVGAYLERNGGVGAIELPQTSDGVTGRAPDSVAGIAASALPSVVTLHVSGDSAQGTGTGFVLDERGHILTNNHVVDPAGAGGDISVTFSGGETAKATIVGRDTGYDLAVVKVSGVSGLKPLPLGNSEEVRVGDPVVAIGAPFDLANTVTSGIISAKERPITAGGESGNVSDVSYVDALQTDAPINPGNSGGPLLDGKARVIGINSAIRSAGSGSESDGGQAGSIGLGFAIPINQGKRVAEELINTGKATHPVIGVTLDMDYSGDGARIGDGGDGGGSGVTSGGPADRAGMRSGDVITEVDGQRVHSGDELIVKVRAHRPGDRLELTLLRDGRERTVTLTLGSSGGD